MMEYIISLTGVGIGAFGFWWAYIRIGQLSFFGESQDVDFDTSYRSTLTLKFRVQNTGAVPIQLRELFLRQNVPKGDFGVLKGKFWAASIEVDGKPFDLMRVPITFTGFERRQLSCRFCCLEQTPIGNAGLAFVDLIIREKGRFRERQRRALTIQVLVGKRIEVAFPGAINYSSKQYDKWRGALESDH